jgi:hypothetical protein
LPGEVFITLKSEEEEQLLELVCIEDVNSIFCVPGAFLPLSKNVFTVPGSQGGSSLPSLLFR